MLTKLTIPKKIHVGFQSRKDTYTGKLAFVVYTDAKGVLRKETSWNSWRDKKIDAEEYENEPVSGFVLNKKVGDYRGGWNGRKAWIRIFDPRGFEFEISVANLLFILEETSAIKGKGLEGEFVYSWDGTELVLLPVDSQEYKSSTEFTALQTKKVTQKEMREGCVYVNKDNQHVMYLGRHNWNELDTTYSENRYSQNYYQYRYVKQTKLHIFVSVDGKSTYWTQKGFTNLAAKLSDDPSPLFAEEFEKFKKSISGAEPTKLLDQPHNVNISSGRYYDNYNVFLKKNGKYYPIRIEHKYEYTGAGSGVSTKECYVTRGTNPVQLDLTKTLKVKIPTEGNSRETISIDELKKLDIVKLYVENDEGARTTLLHHYNY